MKCIAAIITPIMIFGATYNLRSGQDHWPELKGPYLGQKPPGKKSEIFAPGLISTPKYSEVLDTNVTNKWRIHFYRNLPDKTLELTTEFKNGKWTRPSHAVYFTGPNCPELPLIPDGKLIAIAVNRSIDGKSISLNGGQWMVNTKNGFDIWVARETNEGGHQIRWLGPEINSKNHDSWASMAKDGMIYFYSDRPGGMGSSDIYMTKPINGKYSKAKNIGPPVNTQYGEADPYVAPGGRYMVFCSSSLLREKFGKGDLFVTFRKPDDSWSKPINMGSDINTSESETRPMLTRDGKYMFFSRENHGTLDIYWVSTKIIDELKPKELK